MKSERATLAEVNDAIRRVCRTRTGESPEEVLGKLGWTIQEYRIALVESGTQRGAKEK